MKEAEVITRYNFCCDRSITKAALELVSCSSVRFLQVKNNRYDSILKDHTVVRGFDSVCYTFREDKGTILKEEFTDALNCQYEEADTRLVFHLDRIMPASLTSTVSVRSNDTDVLVLLVCYAGVAHNCPKVWMGGGLSINNTRRYISIPKPVDELEHIIQQVLPGLHAFTGTYFTASGPLTSW